ncbi:MAG: efflux RND transporter permease subunit [SAR324 cluster bacterium]|nr:efflux RND transporter permease subunit [SAR324 cluster bacterium]
MIRWMAQNKVASNLLMFMIVGAGLLIGTDTRQEVFPEFDLDSIQIVIPYPGAPPSEIEEALCIPVEKAVQSIDGIKKIQSWSYEGAGRLLLELEADSDQAKVLEEVKYAVDRITTIPEDAEAPMVQLVQIKRGVLSLVIYGDASPQILKEWSEIVKDTLLQNPEITQAETADSLGSEISIEISEAQLRRYQLTLPQISQIIRQYTLDLPAGKLKTAAGDILIRTKSRRYSAAEYAEIPVITDSQGVVTLGEIANIQDTLEESDLKKTYNGFPATLIDVYRVGDQTPTRISEVVQEMLTSLNPRLPASLRIAILNDRSRILQDRIDLLMRNLRMGLILVFVVLALFLDVKLSFWIMMGIPVAFLGALGLMPALGASINMISLFAYILMLGIVVDDAIVVGENIYTYQEKGLTPEQAAVEGAREISIPVVMSVLTTMAAFTPLFFVPGTTGKFFVIIPYIVIIILGFSLIESLFILPAHLSHPSRWKFPGSGLLEIVRRYVSRGLEFVSHKIYLVSLRIALEFRYTSLALAVFMILCSVGFVAGGRMKFTFMPKIDADVVRASLTMPFGTPAHLTEAATAKMIQDAQVLIRKYEDEKKHPVSTGVFSVSGNGGGNESSVNVYLKSLDERGFSAAEFTRKWQTLVGEIPGAEALQFRFSTGAGPANDLEIQMSHPDFFILDTLVSRLKQEMSQYPGVSNIDDNLSDGKPEIQLSLRPEGVLAGFNEQGLTQQIRAAFQGIEVLKFIRDQNEVNVKLRYPIEERSWFQNLETMIVRSPQGQEMPLFQVAFLRKNQAFSQIERIDGQRIVNVSASVDENVSNSNEIVLGLQSGIVKELKEQFPQLHISFEGASSAQKESMDSLKKYGILALFMIFGLLALQFRSYLQPIIIMSAIPFGVIGAIWGHFFMGYDLSIISMMGIVALTGIVVNDSLIMVDFINQARENGETLIQSILEAGVRRFRPILLTSLTTFFGLIPMIFEQSLQARFLIPMALSLAFGVMFATVITLVLIPVLYLILDDAVSFVKKTTAWLSSPFQESVS